MTIRLSRLIPAVLAAAVTTVACGSSATSGSATMTTFVCPETDPTSPQNSACRSCASSQCNSDLTTAFGSDWASDEYAGTCASYVECIARCGCSDGTCVTNCFGAVSGDCMSALSGVSTCFSQLCGTPCNPLGDAE